MIKVLIVDDEPLARENLRVFLQEQSETYVPLLCEAPGYRKPYGCALDGIGG